MVVIGGYVGHDVSSELMMIEIRKSFRLASIQFLYLHGEALLLCLLRGFQVPTSTGVEWNVTSS